MIRFVFIIIISFSFGSSRAQAVTGHGTWPVAGIAVTEDREKISSNDSATTAIGASKALVDVLFATNEDCDLYINGDFKGAILKKEYKYLKLAPGTYIYRARSKSISDELKESFEVKEGESNEVFIDFLFFIDEKKKSTTATSASNTSARAPASNESNPVNSEAAKTAAINAILSNMVSIKGGSFIMGNNRAPAGDELEHGVAINSLLFSKYEITQGQWESIMGSNPSENKGCASCPVENVSWEEVIKFIKKINVASNKRFRLPTEAEWEYVAKLGGRTEIDNAGGQEEYIRKTAWYFANSDKKTHPVGSLQPNTSGIYDLYGNVSEWCSDWYGLYFYRDDDSQKNPEGPPLGKEKVIRGGSFVEYVGDRFRPSLRNKLKPTVKSKDVGFRLVLDINN